MFIKETDQFPVIRVSYQPQDSIPVKDNLEIYESLLDKEQNFVFVSQGPFPEAEPNHEERKMVAAWVKQKREILTQYVKALVHIEPNEQIRLAEQKFANNFIKFSGYPMFIVENEEQADQIINSVLKLH